MPDIDIGSIRRAFEKHQIKPLTRVAVMTGRRRQETSIIHQTLKQLQAEVLELGASKSISQTDAMLSLFEPQVVFLDTLKQLSGLSESLIDSFEKIVVLNDLKNLNADEFFIATLFSPPISAAGHLIRWEDLVQHSTEITESLQ